MIRMSHSRVNPFAKKHSASGFTLIELIIVITLMAFIYTVGLPDLNLNTETEVATKIGKLSADIRSAYDLSVLTGKNYRMVIEFNSGDYWLEEADRKSVFLGTVDLDRDPTEDEEKQAQDEFNADFEEFVELAGDVVEDAEDETEIPPTSPVLEAKEKLKPVEWNRVDTAEWANRSFGPNLSVMSMQAEHHVAKVSAEESGSDVGNKARGFLYFFPQGYVERAVIHIGVKKDDFEWDEDEKPYTIVTYPYEGMAEIRSGMVEYEELARGS